jgi:hypothetical protein
MEQGEQKESAVDRLQVRVLSAVIEQIKQLFTLRSIKG